MAICETCDYANRLPCKFPCSECDKTMGSPFCCYEHEEKPTNADRIRAMSDEELAELIVDNYPMYAWNKEVRHIFFDGPRITHKEAWLQWLKQPAE